MIAQGECAEATHHAGDGVLAADHRLHVVLERLARTRGCVEIVRVAASNVKFPTMPQNAVTITPSSLSSIHARDSFPCVHCATSKVKC